MTVYVFTGPTLSAADVAAELEAVCLPPVAQGDVDQLIGRAPTAIAIIDGYFERVPAVWHKEILLALSEGIHVFGAASMGALRAAELAPFGMVGVGEVFEAYRTGELIADDEVAVMHAPETEGWRPLSEAMVNVRATVRAALREGVVDAPAAAALLAAATRRFYPDRVWPGIVNDAREGSGNHATLDRFLQWLPEGRVDQKRADAVALLRHVRAFLATDPRPFEARFTFERTDLWERGRRRVAADPERSTPSTQPAVEDGLFEEIALIDGLWERVTMRALAGVLASEEARRHRFVPSDRAVEGAIHSLRVGHRLMDHDTTAAWLEAQRLDAAGLRRLAGGDAELRWVGSLMHQEVLARLPEELRRAGLYADLRRRAATKATVLAHWGLENPGMKDTGLDEHALQDWWFGQQGTAVPVDIAAHAASLGFADLDEFRLAIVREHVFRRLTEAPAEDQDG
jgi:hypothetical protein